MKILFLSCGSLIWFLNGASVTKWLAHLPSTSKVAGPSLSENFPNASRTQSSSGKCKRPTLCLKEKHSSRTYPKKGSKFFSWQTPVKLRFKNIFWTNTCKFTAKTHFFGPISVKLRFKIFLSYHNLYRKRSK